MTRAEPRRVARRDASIRPDRQPETIHHTGASLRQQRTTSRRVTEECLDRIDARNPGLRAFTAVTAAEARAEATDADRELAAGIDRGALHGIPISLKDLIDVAHTRTSAASRVTEGRLATRDASVVRRLRECGAVLIGKTNLHEFAFGTTSEDSAFGAVRNPWDERRSAGGSSGGSAVSVACRMALGSIGTDTGGSVRIPAAACGVVGLKPTVGELPTDGVIPLSPTLDHLGVIAATVTDTFLLYSALKGNIGRGRLVRASLVDVRFGVLYSYFCDTLDPEVAGLFERALSLFSGARARLTERQVPGAASVPSVFVNLQAPEAFAYHAPFLEKSAAAYTAAVRARIERGASISAADYVAARNAREALTDDVDRMLEDLDVLVLPTLPIPAPLLGAEQVMVDGVAESVRVLMLKMTQLFNITGHPAISIPCGWTAAGLPVGLQLVGRRNRTLRLLEIARGCEAVLSLASKRRR
jgi:aspartyl-tRNA(Asn)/glutamyl-tRNA(Gln) amidotransferase subunit A